VLHTQQAPSNILFKGETPTLRTSAVSFYPGTARCVGGRAANSAATDSASARRRLSIVFGSDWTPGMLDPELWLPIDRWTHVAIVIKRGDAKVRQQRRVPLRS
jgi:hypothetical protein